MPSALRSSLAAARHNGGMTFTALMALMSSSFFMSLTGGGLTPYEARAAQAMVAGLFGDEAAAAELERAVPYSSRSSVHLIPANMIRVPAMEAEFETAAASGDLLGGPARAMRVISVADAGQLPLEPASGEADAMFVLASADASLTP